MSVADLSPRVWVGLSGPNPADVLNVGPWRLIGTVLNRERRTLDPATDREPRSYERKMLSRFWGRFVGVELDRDGAVAAVLRDPSGGLDCVVWALDGLTLVGSEIPLWAMPKSSSGWCVAWDRVAQALHNPLLAWGDLLIDGPLAVSPGGLQPLPLPQAPATLWCPADVARRAPTRPLADAEAADALAASIDEAVRGLGRRPGLMGAEVSGGLDSSLVAAGLVGSGRAVTLWLNLFGSEASSDEGVFVDVLAESLGVSVTRVPHAAGDLTREIFEAVSQGVRPGLGGLDSRHDADWADRFQKAGIRAVMTGRGGDSVLLQAATAEVFADLWRARGLRALVSPLLPALAALNEQSVWSVIRQARLAAKGARRPASDTPLLTPLTCPVTIPEWLQGTEDLGPARRSQIAGLIHGIGRQAPSLQTRVVDILTPLLALPVVETALSIPTWQLTLNGRDRGLARTAFRGRLPDLILDRRTKGEMSAIYGRMIVDSLDVLRPWLLDGRLAREGLIDRDAAHALLTQDSLIHRGIYGHVMITAAFEGFVRAWEHRLDRARSNALEAS